MILMLHTQFTGNGERLQRCYRRYVYSTRDVAAASAGDTSGAGAAATDAPRSDAADADATRRAIEAV